MSIFLKFNEIFFIFIVAEDYEGMIANKKKYLWDKNKKRYVIGKKDDLGRIKKDMVGKKGDKSNDKSKKLL